MSTTPSAESKARDAKVQALIGNQSGTTINEDLLEFPGIVKNAAGVFKGNDDFDDTSAHLECVKATFESLKNSFLEVKAVGGFVSLLEKPNPFANVNKENGGVKSYEEEVANVQKELLGSQSKTNKEKSTLRGVIQEVQHVYQATKRKFAETEKLLKEVNAKRSRVTANTDVLQEKFSDENIKTVDGCKDALETQTKTMKTLGEKEVSMQKQLAQLENEMAPIKAEIETLMALAEEDKDDDEEIKELAQSIDSLEEMKTWYLQVNGLIQSIEGVMLDVDEEDMLKKDAWKQAFEGGNKIKLRLDDDKDKHILIIMFENGTLKLKNAEIHPADVPVEDILLASKSLSDKGDLAMLIREVRVRLRAKRDRMKEVEDLKRSYPAVRLQYKGSKESPMLSHTLKAHVTISAGIVVVLEMDPDYPQPYASPYLVELVGVMGWSDEAMDKMTEEVRGRKLRRVLQIVKLVEELASESSDVIGPDAVSENMAQSHMHASTDVDEDGPAIL